MNSQASIGNCFSPTNRLTSERKSLCNWILSSASVSISRSSRKRNNRSSPESISGQEFREHLPMGRVDFAVPTVPAIHQLGDKNVHVRQRLVAQSFGQILCLQQPERQPLTS